MTIGKDSYTHKPNLPPSTSPGREWKVVSTIDVTLKFVIVSDKVVTPYGHEKKVTT